MKKIQETKLRKYIQKEIKNILEEDETVDQSIEEFFNSIDFTPVTNELSKRLGIKVQPRYSYKENNGKYRLIVESDNLIKHAGIFKSVISRVQIQNFSSHIDLKEKTMWSGIDLQYPGNGMSILTARYSNGKWSFRGEPRS